MAAASPAPAPRQRRTASGSNAGPDTVAVTATAYGGQGSAFFSSGNGATATVGPVSGTSSGGGTVNVTAAELVAPAALMEATAQVRRLRTKFPVQPAAL